MAKNELRNAVGLSHHFLRERVLPGDRVVDATCGNGRDTLLLAQLVGPAGRVWGFDLQTAALEATRVLLEEHDCMSWVELVAAGHEQMAERVPEPLAAVIFNLGYLPGGNRAVITRSDTTCHAMAQALSLLLPGGLLVVAVYTGHPGGTDEGEAVAAWAAGLSPVQFNVWESRQPNRHATSPWLLVVEKAHS